MRKWEVTLSAKLIATYTVEAKSEEEAVEIANEVFHVKLEREAADSNPRILSYCEDYEDNIEEVKEWTDS